MVEFASKSSNILYMFRFFPPFHNIVTRLVPVHKYLQYTSKSFLIFHCL
ncbi:hypothetical protein T4D_15438 [Trichinella pseudospiralis]|uniref:Uncharacterized protein n=1 Tax=Trichinella pseudospiralis TaxID=6337 RepID=A0A0V1DRW6_TRIPS|nr:hypothetical protein T4D_15438 [Trichinella pseudospiralis]